MTAAIRTLYVRGRLFFPHTLYDIVPYARHRPICQVFFPSITLVSYASTATAECNVDRLITGVINPSTGINGVRLAHHIS